MRTAQLRLRRRPAVRIQSGWPPNHRPRRQIARNSRLVYDVFAGACFLLPPDRFATDLLGVRTPVAFTGDDGDSCFRAARLAAHRFFVASAIRFRPSGLNRRFFVGGVPSAADLAGRSRPSSSRNAEIARSIAFRCRSSSEMMRVMSFNDSPLACSRVAD
jgi:hypothetical protein